LDILRGSKGNNSRIELAATERSRIEALPQFARDYWAEVIPLTENAVPHRCDQVVAGIPQGAGNQSQSPRCCLPPSSQPTQDVKNGARPRQQDPGGGLYDNAVRKAHALSWRGEPLESLAL